ncbi:MAG: DUF805 domain-containing protein [Pseudomonadota bacterium]
MGALLSSYERFVTRTFNFWGRATPFEYWTVMPLVWGIFVYLFVGDVYDVQRILALGYVPPLNPFYLESITFFLLTFLSRMTLGIRRYHDQGRSGFWILLPLISLMSGLVLLLALFGAMMNSSLTGLSQNPSAASNLTYPLELARSNPDAFWQEMTLIAKIFDRGADYAIGRLFVEAFQDSGGVNLQSTVADIVSGNADYSEAFVLGSLALVMVPVLTAVAHLLMMVLPSAVQDNAFGTANVRNLNTRIITTIRGSRSPMSAYAHLFDESTEEAHQKRLTREQELAELYRMRIKRDRKRL